eukprot:5815713-Pleurochrysis_carterae.AAC.4
MRRCEEQVVETEVPNAALASLYCQCCVVYAQLGASQDWAKCTDRRKTRMAEDNNLYHEKSHRQLPIC